MEAVGNGKPSPVMTDPDGPRGGKKKRPQLQSEAEAVSVPRWRGITHDSKNTKRPPPVCPLVYSGHTSWPPAATAPGLAVSGALGTGLFRPLVA
jgi:hypothetical protein